MTRVPSRAGFPYRGRNHPRKITSKIGKTCSEFNNLALWRCISSGKMLTSIVTYWYPYLLPSPGKRAREETFYPFEEKKEEKIKMWNLDGSLVITGDKCHTTSQTSMHIYI
jgi:hypothetical protein